MKKTFLIILILSLCFSAFAIDFEFTPVSVSSIYKTNKADIWNFSTQGQILYGLDSKLNKVLVQSKYEVGRESSYLNFNKVNGPYVEEYVNELASFTSHNYNLFLRLKPAVTLGFAKVKLNDFKVQGFFQIGLNTVLSATNGNDLLGYDGLYCYGLEASYKDLVAIKIGKHHYSGHYGDEVVESLYSRSDNLGRSYSSRFKASSQDTSYIEKTAEYVRQDSLILGVSVSPHYFVRFYTEADFVLHTMNTIRPYVVVPNKIRCSFQDCDMVGRIGSNEGIMQSDTDTRRYPYSDKYVAMIINAGVEFSYPFKNAGTLSVSYNCRVNQEGQTMYQFNCYKDSNPWSVDYSLLIDYKFNNSPLSAQIMYHNGQIPMLNYFFQRGSYVTVGFGLDF